MYNGFRPLNRENNVMNEKKEDYIKVLFDLGGSRNRISNKLVAERLKVSPSTVTEMMVSLEKINWVNTLPYKGSILTEEGKALAKQLIYKHRLWEVFLVNHLGYDINEVHDEAELLEHSTSLLLAKRLEAYLKFPEYCPHGGAIPLNLIEAQEDEIIPLTECQVGDIVEVQRMTNEEYVADYFSNKDVKINDILEYLDENKRVDTITIRNVKSDNTIELNSTTASYLFVKSKR